MGVWLGAVCLLQVVGSGRRLFAFGRGIVSGIIFQRLWFFDYQVAFIQNNRSDTEAEHGAEGNHGIVDGRVEVCVRRPYVESLGYESKQKVRGERNSHVVRFEVGGEIEVADGRISNKIEQNIFIFVRCDNQRHKCGQSVYYRRERQRQPGQFASALEEGSRHVSEIELIAKYG